MADDGPLPTWWALSGNRLMDMLRQVAAGEDPDLVYAEHYANSEVTQVHEEDDDED